MNTTTGPQSPPPLPWEVPTAQPAAQPAAQSVHAGPTPGQSVTQSIKQPAQPSGNSTGKPNRPQFADRAEKDAWYRQQHYAGTNHPEATAYNDLMAARGKPVAKSPSATSATAQASNGAETLSLELPAYMIPFLIGVSRTVGAGITTIKIIWHLFAIVTAVALLGTLIGVLTA